MTALINIDLIHLLTERKKNMKIIIDIPEYLYKEVVNDEEYGVERMRKAVINGTILPDNIDNSIDNDTYKESLIEEDAPIIFKSEHTMREATDKENKSVNNYIKSISVRTGINFDLKKDIDKIEKEISNLVTCRCEDSCEGDWQDFINKDDVLRIIKKYKEN